jgi:hypothetical protein
LVLPHDLVPGEPLSVRYVDEWGDPWVEVDRVPDVEVVPPQAEERPPSIESASSYVVAGDQVCVCGAFQPEDIVAPFVFGSVAVEAVSVSRNIAWLQTPEGPPGPSLIRSEGARGEASTDLLRVRAELDQEHLFSGQSTPLRIVIEGSSRNLPLRITNTTPGVIQVEGGNDQQTESSGGAVNQVTRQVRGVERGAFGLSWELRPAPCPCVAP